MADWISVKDGLPPTNEAVLIIVDGRPEKNIKLVGAYEFGEYTADDGWIVDAYPEWRRPTVRYWMRLPEPPKDDEWRKGGGGL